MHLILYGRNPIVTVRVNSDVPGVGYFEQIYGSPESSDASVVRIPRQFGGIPNYYELQISCAAVAATDPCDAWIQVPTDVNVEFTFGAAETWPVPVSVSFGGVQAVQSLWEGEINAERSAASGNPPSIAPMQLSYGVTVQHGNPVSGIPPLTAKWRGAYQIGCVSDQTGEDPAKTDHFYNVVDFPTLPSRTLPFDQNSIKNCQYPPDDPKAHAEG